MPRLLSDLIREGAAKRPQAIGVLYVGPDGDWPQRLAYDADADRAREVGCSCAIGAALEAAGWEVESLGGDGPFGGNIWPAAWGEADEADDLLSDVYTHNDSLRYGDGGMTREQIADWLVSTGRDVEVPLRAEIGGG